MQSLEPYVKRSADGKTILQILDDMIIQAHYLRTSVGYRHQLWAGALRPSVENRLRRRLARALPGGSQETVCSVWR